MPAQGAVLAVCGVLTATLPVLGNQVPFDYPLETSNLDVELWLKVYEGHPHSNLLFEMRQSAAATGHISGVAGDTGGTVDTLTVSTFTGRITDPLYTDTYFNGIHIEANSPSLGLISDPVVLSVGPAGGFNGYIRQGVEPNTLVTIRVGDLVSYDVPFRVYPLTIGVPFHGNVSIVDGRAVLNVLSEFSGWEYLGDYIPGLDYSIELGIQVGVTVPEPVSLAVFAFGGLVLAWRRR